MLDSTFGFVMAIFHTQLLTCIGYGLLCHVQLNILHLHILLNYQWKMKIEIVKVYPEGEVLEMEGGIQEQRAEGEPREDKSVSEWCRR